MQNENNNDNNVIRDCDVIGMLLFSSCSFVTSPGQSPSITADPSAPTQPPLSQCLHSSSHSIIVCNRLESDIIWFYWPIEALFLSWIRRKDRSESFMFKLVFPMSINDDLDFFCFPLFLPSLSMKCGVLQRNSALWFLWCDRNAKICSHPCTKRHRRTSWSLGPCDSIGGTPAEFSIELAWERISMYSVRSTRCTLYCINSDPWNNTSHKSSPIYILPYIVNAGQGNPKMPTYCSYCWN